MTENIMKKDEFAAALAAFLTESSTWNWHGQVDLETAPSADTVQRSRGCVEAEATAEAGAQSSRAKTRVPRGTLDEGRLAKLERYAEMLVEWNQKFNLVAESTLPDLWRRHFLDSAQLVGFIPPCFSSDEERLQLDPGLRRDDVKNKESVEKSRRPLVIADMGSGAGFPGLVLSILTDHELHLIESIGKKASFLRAVVEELGLNVTVHQKRIEEMKDFRADIITARALKALPELLGYAKHLMKKGSFCLFLKGQTLDAELTEAAKCWKFDPEIHTSLSDHSGSVLILRNLQFGGSFAQRRPHRI